MLEPKWLLRKVESEKPEAESVVAVTGEAGAVVAEEAVAVNTDATEAAAVVSEGAEPGEQWTAKRKKKKGRKGKIQAEVVDTTLVPELLPRPPESEALFVPDVEAVAQQVMSEMQEHLSKELLALLEKLGIRLENDT